MFAFRYSHMCHMVGDRLVAVGGINLLPNTPGIGVVNLRTGQAQEFSFPVSETLLLSTLMQIVRSQWVGKGKQISVECSQL